MDFELPPIAPSQKAQFCAAETIKSPILEVKFLGKRVGGMHSFATIRDEINSACMNCHLAPSNAEGVTYIDSYLGQELTLGGVTKYYPGLFEMAEKFRDAIFSTDPEKQMPPLERRQNNPEAFLRIGKHLDAWIAAGKPNGNFSLPNAENSNEPLPPAPMVESTEIGDCTPRAEIMGFDYKRDRMFADATVLPQSLIDTDLFSLDAFDLAQKGTVAYNVEYPLWADNAEKGRWVHVPMKREGSKLIRQSIQYDPATKKFAIPDNTRFYKTFYRLVKQANGKSRYRRIETRIILVRTPWENSLFGTYRWDETEQVATLVETPYRDGTTFKDTIFDVVIDEKTQKARRYAIPGRHRCIECHMGAEAKNAILGFTPLQINRRAPGELARNQEITKEELTLADRLAAYGVVGGYQKSEELPRLEWTGSENPRNIYEFRAQAYMVGNCAHCHNPGGFAFTKENGITLELSAGTIFNFNTYTRSTQVPTRTIVSESGDLTRSHLYLKVSDPPAAQGLTSRMPMHTPGSPDCGVLTMMGKWVRSFESIDAARDWKPDCKTSEHFDWVDQDFTWPKSDTYTPRRADWNSTENGMSRSYRELEFPGLDQLVSKRFAVGYWNAKDSCKFPEIPQIPESEQRPWMFQAGVPKKPFGQVYYTTPGSWYFRTTCVKCHGPKADGNTGLARGILSWSGGSVRVANLMDGLFGNQGANLRTFDITLPNGQTKNLAPNYLIWMAMEGTRVKFPPEAASFLGKHGGQMLNQVREKCLRQISPDKASSTNYADHEVYRTVCFHNNRTPEDPQLRFDPNTAAPLHPEVVEAWLNRAAFNAGYAIYDYLKKAGEGSWAPGNDECEVVFPKQ